MEDKYTELNLLLKSVVPFRLRNGVFKSINMNDVDNIYETFKNSKLSLIYMNKDSSNTNNVQTLITDSEVQISICNSFLENIILIALNDISKVYNHFKLKQLSYKQDQNKVLLFNSIAGFVVECLLLLEPNNISIYIYYRSVINSDTFLLALATEHIECGVLLEELSYRGILLSTNKRAIEALSSYSKHPVQTLRHEAIVLYDRKYRDSDSVKSS